MTGIFSCLIQGESKNCNSAKESPLLQNQVEVLKFLKPYNIRIRMLYLLVTLCEKMKFMAFTVCLFWTFLLRDSIYVFVHETSEFSGPLLKFFLYVSVLMFMQSFSKI